MLHAATVSNSVQAYNPSSMVLNRVYWVRAKNAETQSRQLNKVSTKILGFGVFMIGVVALAVGLIMGVEFPIHIREKIVKDNCILDKDHEFYEKWARDRSYTRYNRLYYWEIQNVEDFLRGMPPVFTEKGPYVYLERRTRLNVVFNNALVSYHTMYTQTFSPQLTRAQCGHTCTEHGKITTINTSFLKKLHAFGSWASYIKAYRPGYITTLLGNWSASAAEVSQQLLHHLSCATPQCHTLGQTASQEHLNIATLLSFGHFVKRNDSIHKQLVLQSTEIVNGTGYILPGFVRAMYKHLSEAVNSSPESCYKLSEQTTMVWNLQLQMTDNKTSESDSSKQYSDPNTTEFTVYLSKSCDISDAVSLAVEHMSNFSGREVRWTFSMCDGHVDDICDTVEDGHDSIVALLAVTKDFVDMYLLNTISSLVLPFSDNSIVHSKPQSELAKGYQRQRNAGDPYHVTEVEGILPHHVDVNQAFHRSPEIVAGTCLEHGNTDNNMAVRWYNGSQFAPPGVYSRDGQHVCGYLADFPPSAICRACTRPRAESHAYHVFLPDLFRSVQFEYVGEIQKYDNWLYSYKLSEGSFGGSHNCDLVNTTAIHQFPSFVGRPAYGKSGCEYLTRQLNSRHTDYVSTIEVEPRTGRLWFESIKLQTSAMVVPETLDDVTGRLFPALTSTATPIPLYWVDKQAKISQEDIDYFEYRIARLMTVSCGGLIGLVTLSLLIMVLSVFVGLLSNRKNKVHVLPEEPSLSNRAQP